MRVPVLGLSALWTRIRLMYNLVALTPGRVAKSEKISISCLRYISIDKVIAFDFSKDFGRVGRRPELKSVEASEIERYDDFVYREIGL